MAVGRNQHGEFQLADGFANQHGHYERVGSLAELTRTEFERRGCVITDSSGCQAWTRAKMNGWQYGVINLESDGRKRSHLAHRVSLHLAGVLDYRDPRHVLHTCDKPWCVNPAHLRPGTNAENIRDRQERRSPRPTWRSTWFTAAQIIALRSECVRRQAGCVIVGPDDRVVSSGFNGKPGEFPVSGPCDDYCPRAQTGGSLDYSDCLFVHSEMNALMYSDRTRREHGTAYVTSCPCLACAKALANSGLSQVVCAVGTEDRDRSPERSIELMMKSGLFVEIWYQPRWQMMNDEVIS